MTEQASAVLPLPEPRFHFMRTLGDQRFGRYDPSATLTKDALIKVYHGVAGPVRATVRMLDGELRLGIEGPGASDEMEAWMSMWPPDDGYAEFETDHPTVNRFHRSMPGLRIVRHPWLFDVACKAILQQRVTWEEALRSWRRMSSELGTEVGGLRTMPSPAVLARLHPRGLLRFDIDFHRAKAIVGLARAELSRPFLTPDTTHAVLRDRLLAVRGIGPWTAELTLGSGAGDTDAVPTGDLHMPDTVSWALAGEARGSDERMLELLEPFLGQRFRVIRLLKAARAHAPSFAPKKPRRPYR